MIEQSRLYRVLCIVLALGVFPLTTPADEKPAAKDIVDGCLKYMRGKASESVVEMTIHRPDWERTMTIKAWTKGKRDSLLIITDPPKDQGNGVLKKGGEMWIYNPKVNRVIKLPPSMMAQSWKGSDFSNNDIAKSDTVVDDYDHEIESTEEHEGKTVYVIKSLPKPGAPVIWGMQRLKIREDFILLSEMFYDEDHEPVKTLFTDKIGTMSGKLFPVVWTMRKADAENEYTRMRYKELTFKEDLPDGMFTISALKSRRR